MTNETLLSLKGDIFIGVKSNAKIDIRTLIKIKDIIANGYEYDAEVDLNEDGVIDEEDLNLITEILLNVEKL